MKNVSKRMKSKTLSEITSTMIEGGDIIECDINGDDLEHGKAKFYR